MPSYAVSLELSLRTGVMSGGHAVPPSCHSHGSHEDEQKLIEYEAPFADPKYS